MSLTSGSTAAQSAHASTSLTWPVSSCVLHTAEVRQMPPAPGARLVCGGAKKSRDREHPMQSSREQEARGHSSAETQLFLKITETTGVQGAKQKKNPKQYKAAMQKPIYPLGGIGCSRIKEGGGSRRTETGEGSGHHRQMRTLLQGSRCRPGVTLRCVRVNTRRSTGG